MADLTPGNSEIYVTPLVRVDGLTDEMNGYTIDPIFLPAGTVYSNVPTNGIQVIDTVTGNIMELTVASGSLVVTDLGPPA